MSTPYAVIVVKAARDPEAGVWFVESSDVPGLNLEAETLEGLADKLPGAILDLLEAGGGLDTDGAVDVPIELIAHASTRVRYASPVNASCARSAATQTHLR